MKHARYRTLLGDWMRLATEEERVALAENADTSLNYLYQLAGVHRENPKVRLALAIVRVANTLREDRLRCACNNDKDPGQYADLPYLTLQSLATPTRH